MKNILLIDPDKEQGKVLANWLEEEGYGVSQAHNPKQAYSFLSKEKLKHVIIDIDSPENKDALLELCRTTKTEPGFSDISVIVLTYKKDGKQIADALEAGADNFILKPFETDLLLARMTTISKEIELKKKGKKVLALNYINYLIKIAGDVNRDSFFLLAGVIFNKLIVNEIEAIIGEPIIALILKRLEELIGKDYPFMRELNVQNGRLIMDGADKASRDIPVRTLTFAFRDYVYAFLHLVGTLTSDILMDREPL